MKNETIAEVDWLEEINKINSMENFSIKPKRKLKIVPLMADNSKVIPLSVNECLEEVKPSKGIWPFPKRDISGNIILPEGSAEKEYNKKFINDYEGAML